MPLLREELIGGHIQITFTDRSVRYFGDYNKVTIIVNIIDLKSNDSSCIGQKLEKMAVSTCDITRIQEQMINSYLDTVRKYILKDDFFIKAQQKRKSHSVNWPRI